LYIKEAFMDRSNKLKNQLEPMRVGKGGIRGVKWGCNKTALGQGGEELALGIAHVMCPCKF
jgi:hypothetical protein